MTLISKIISSRRSQLYIAGNKMVCPKSSWLRSEVIEAERQLKLCVCTPAV